MKKEISLIYSTYIRSFVLSNLSIVDAHLFIECVPYMLFICFSQIFHFTVREMLTVPANTQCLKENSAYPHTYPLTTTEAVFLSKDFLYDNRNKIILK